MCSAPPLCSSHPLSTALCPARPIIYPSVRPLPWHVAVSSDRDKPTWGGTAGSLGSGKNTSPSSSILQPYLVKANTGQHIPSCHWKRVSDALAWHADIVTRTNDDARLASLFMACLKKEGKFEGSGKQRMFNSPIINKCVRGKVDESSSCCKQPGGIAVTSTSYATRACTSFFSLTAKPNIQDSRGRTRMSPKITCSSFLDNKKCQV